MQGLDLSVVADELGELGRGGLLGGQAGDGVGRLDGGLPDVVVGAAALDLDGLAGSRKEEAVGGGGVDPADLRAVVARCPGCVPEAGCLSREGTPCAVSCRGRSRRPVERAARIRSSARARNPWWSSNSAMGRPAVLVAKQVSRMSSESVILNWAPGWDRSLRTISRRPFPTP